MHSVTALNVSLTVLRSEFETDSEKLTAEIEYDSRMDPKLISYWKMSVCDRGPCM